MDDCFDPFKGYEETTREGFYNIRSMWFDQIPTATLSRNAYYQGFITKYEYTQLTSGRGVFTEDGSIKWIDDLPGKHKGPYPDEKLTRKRIEMIKANHILGLGDGTTSF